MFKRTIAMVVSTLFVFALLPWAGSQAAPAGAVSASAGASQSGLTARKRNKWKTCDVWSGDWAYVTQTGDGGTISGNMDLDVYNHERAAGPYTASTSGWIKGDIINEANPNKACGKRWVGTFKDRSGELRNKGKFWAKLYVDEHGRWAFYGEYCVKSPSFPYFCGDYYPWGGVETG